MSYRIMCSCKNLAWEVYVGRVGRCMGGEWVEAVVQTVEHLGDVVSLQTARVDLAWGDLVVAWWVGRRLCERRAW